MLDWRVRESNGFNWDAHVRSVHVAESLRLEPDRVHVPSAGYQVYTMPVMDMIECSMVRHGISNGTIMRLFYRTIYVVLIAFVAVRDLPVLHPCRPGCLNAGSPQCTKPDEACMQASSFNMSQCAAFGVLLPGRGTLFPAP